MILLSNIGEKCMNKEDFWWAVHNIVGHPLMEISKWVGMKKFSYWIHDATLPKLDKKK